jgi:hypothetical protein
MRWLIGKEGMKEEGPMSPPVKGGGGERRVMLEGGGRDGSVCVCDRGGGRRALTCLKAAIAGSHASMSAAESLGFGVIEKTGCALATAACCPRISSRNCISALECDSALEFSARRAASEARGMETITAALFD